MSTTRSVLWTCGVLVALGFGGWFVMAGAPGKQAATASTPASLLTVSVVSAHERMVDDTIAVAGATVPRDNVVVVPELSGQQIRAIRAEVGDQVRKGQVLAVLDSANLAIQIDGLRSERERTGGEYERVMALLPQRMVSGEFVAQKKAAHELALSNLRHAQLNQQRASIVAPTDGLIYERTAAIGSLTNGDAALFQIAKDGVVEVEVDVPERMVTRLKPGLPAVVRLASRTEPVQGTVRLITPSVDSIRRSAKVRIALQPEASTATALPVGVFCEVNVVIDQVNGWVLPGTALQQDNAGTFVWAVRADNTVARMPINVVTRTPEHVVVATMDAGARIVAKAGPFLREGDAVALSGVR